MSKRPTSQSDSSSDYSEPPSNTTPEKKQKTSLVEDNNFMLKTSLDLPALYQKHPDAIWPELSVSSTLPLSSASSLSSVANMIASSHTSMEDTVAVSTDPIKPQPFPWEVDYMIVHQPCMDGTTAIFAAYEYTRRRREHMKSGGFDKAHGLINEPVVFGVTPGNSQGMRWPVEPDTHGKNVAVFDISFEPEKTKELMRVSKSFILFDHHQGGEEKMKGLRNCFFNMKKSGGMMAWEFFFPREAAPPIVQYTQDHDLFTRLMPNSDAISSFMFSELYDPESNMQDMKRWMRLHNGLDPSDENESTPMNWAQAAMAGKRLRRPREEAIQTLVKTCAKRLFHGYVACVVNSNYGLVSDGCAAMLDAHKDADLAMLWQYDYGVSKKDKTTGKPVMRDCVAGRRYPKGYQYVRKVSDEHGRMIPVMELPENAKDEVARLCYENADSSSHNFREDVLEALQKIPHYAGVGLGVGRNHLIIFMHRIEEEEAWAVLKKATQESPLLRELYGYMSVDSIPDQATTEALATVITEDRPLKQEIAYPGGYRVGLRSRAGDPDAPNVNHLAQLHDGAGHPNAAGFILYSTRNIEDELFVQIPSDFVPRVVQMVKAPEGAVHPLSRYPSAP